MQFLCINFRIGTVVQRVRSDEKGSQLASESRNMIFSIGHREGGGGRDETDLMDGRHSRGSLPVQAASLAAAGDTAERSVDHRDRERCTANFIISSRPRFFLSARISPRFQES